MSESAIQLAIVSFIRAVAPQTLVFAVPNAARRSLSGNALNAVPGLTKGIPDLCLCFPGGVGFIEVKTQAGVLSPAQCVIRDRLNKCLVPWAVARSVDDAREILKAWRIDSRESRQSGEAAA